MDRHDDRTARGGDDAQRLDDTLCLETVKPARGFVEEDDGRVGDELHGDIGLAQQGRGPGQFQGGIGTGQRHLAAEHVPQKDRLLSVDDGKGVDECDERFHESIVRVQ